MVTMSAVAVLRKTLVSVIVAAALSGCAGIQMGDPARSSEIKKFRQKTDVAQIYVCRDSRPFGVAIRPEIELDGKNIATLARGTFAYAEVAPGNHSIVAKTMEHDSTIPFSAAAGQQRFFQTWISLGVFSGWGLIEEIDATKGKDCVTEGELVEAVKR